MSVTAVPIRPIKKGSVLKLWLGLGLLALLAILLAWVGTASFRPMTLANGVTIDVVKPGVGPKPTKDDLSLVHYKLHVNSLTSKVIENSRDRGQPAELIADPNVVFSGFAEGLQRMRAGGSYVLTLPPGTHIKTAQPGAPFTPRDTLVFEIDLVQVVAGQAQAFLQMQQMRMMQQYQQMQQMQQGGAPGGPPPGAAEPGAR